MKPLHCIPGSPRLIDHLQLVVKDLAASERGAILATLDANRTSGAGEELPLLG